MPKNKLKKNSKAPNNPADTIQAIKGAVVKGVSQLEQDLKTEGLNIKPEAAISKLLITAFEPVYGSIDSGNWQVEVNPSAQGYSVSILQKQEDGTFKSILHNNSVPKSPTEVLTMINNCKLDNNIQTSLQEVAEGALDQVMGICNNIFRYRESKLGKLSQDKDALIILGVFLAGVVIIVALSFAFMPGLIGVTLSVASMSTLEIVMIFGTFSALIGPWFIGGVSALILSACTLMNEYSKLDKFSPTEFIGSVKENLSKFLDTTMSIDSVKADEATDKRSGWQERMQNDLVTANDIVNFKNMLDKIVGVQNANGAVTFQDLSNIAKDYAQGNLEKMDNIGARVNEVLLKADDILNSRKTLNLSEEELSNAFHIMCTRNPLLKELVADRAVSDQILELLKEHGKLIDKVPHFLNIIDPKIMASVINAQEKAAQIG